MSFDVYFGLLAANEVHEKLWRNYAQQEQSIPSSLKVLTYLHK